MEPLCIDTPAAPQPGDVQIAPANGAKRPTRHVHIFMDSIHTNMYTIHMIMYGIISFQWDDRKAESNAKKHGVSFEEASTVFYDPHALRISDDAHSDEEDRFVIMGLSSVARVLTVCHYSREPDDIILHSSLYTL